MAGEVRQAGFEPLSPVRFLLRAAQFFGDRPAVIYGERQMTYAQLNDRVGRLAAALVATGVKPGDCVVVLAPNIPEMIEVHFAIPLAGGVISPLNLSLDFAAIAFAIEHSGARLVICEQEFVPKVRQALEGINNDIALVVIGEAGESKEPDSEYVDFETLIENASNPVEQLGLSDELQPLSLIYTSGTTARQKAVTYLHRGAYLAAMSNALSFNLDHNSVYLWTWPMFHSNGLSFIWSVTAVGGTHVCMREFNPAATFELIALHRATHFCVAPTTMNTLANDPAASEFRPSPNPDGVSTPSVKCIIGGAAPATASIARLEARGIQVVHQYGSTECYGPVTVCWRRHGWESMTAAERYAMMAKQGTPTPAIDSMIVADLDTLKPVPKDGNTIGEVLVRGNTVMRGYWGDDEATNAALVDGWFRTGDIASWHSDGSLEIKDRSSDLIISGGERISSVEIDEVLYQHPAVQEAAVVASKDDELGEVPGAYITTRKSESVTAGELEEFCREHLPPHKIPRWFEFRELPRTATGKIKKSELRIVATKS